MDQYCFKCGSKIFSIGIYLPCSTSPICLEHFSNDNSHIKCQNCCNNKHYFNDLIKMRANRLNYKKYKFESLKLEIQEKLNQFIQIQSDPVYHIGEQYSDLIARIDLRREELIKEIDSFYFELIRSLKEHQEETIKSFGNNIRNLNINELQDDLDKNKINITENSVSNLQNIDTSLKNLNNLIEKLKPVEKIINQTENNEFLVNENNNISLKELFGCLKLSNPPRPIPLIDIKFELSFKGHASHVNCAIIHNENLFSSACDNTIKMWNLKTGKCLKTFIGHGNYVNSLKISNNKSLISVSNDLTIKVWNIDKGNCIKTLRGHKDNINFLEMNHNGNLITASSDSSIMIWDLDSEIFVSKLMGHSEPVLALALFESGELLSGSADCFIKLWDLKKLICIRTYRSHSDTVSCLAIGKNGFFFSGTADGCIGIWDKEIGMCLRSILTGQFWITCLKLSPFGLVSSSGNGLLNIWNIESEKCEKEIKAHDVGIQNFSIFDKNKIVTCSDDKTIKLWNIS